MKTSLLVFFAVLLTFVLHSCKKDNLIPPEQQPQLSLTLEDVSCTEVWLKLTTANISLPVNVEILKDDNPVRTITLTSADSILYIDSLLPNKTYSFTSIIQSNTQSIKHSISLATLDTTSHDFTWQSWTFGGDAGGCVLYDVAIIDDNDIWAVGEIYLLDTLGQPDPLPYNAVHWDGIEWKLNRIPYYYQGQPYYHPIKSIFAFSINDVWFCGNGVVHWNGSQFIPISVPANVWGSYQMNKLWGTSSNDLYAVGNNGSIAHYNGHSWTKIESGTNLNINDIYGAYNERTSQYEILAPASNVLQSLDRDLLSINGYSVTHLLTEPINGTISTSWFIPDRIYLIGGDGIFKKSNFADSLWEIKHRGITIYYTYCIRGTSINNIALIGAYGDVLHFNGYDFKSFISQTRINGNLYSVDIKNNIIAAVGVDNIKAVITIGERNN